MVSRAFETSSNYETRELLINNKDMCYVYLYRRRVSLVAWYCCMVLRTCLLGPGYTDQLDSHLKESRYYICVRVTLLILMPLAACLISVCFFYAYVGILLNDASSA